MKANELMIGDWVCYSKPNNYCTKVNEIKCTHDVPDDMLYYIKGQRDNRDRLKKEFDETFVVDILSPIHLTPEILEKNGFSTDYRNDDLSYAQSCGDVIGIHVNGEDGLMDEMYFKYVHQLQHALRLCGIEKEIIL